MELKRKLAAGMTAAALMSGFCSVTAFAEATSYPLWVGSTQVTSENMNDILGDGGKARYDPDTQTLTLDSPDISGYHSAHGYSAQIFADSFALTVTGTADFDYSKGGGFLAIWDYNAPLTLKDCDLTSVGFDSAFVSYNYTVSVINSSLDITGIDATGNNSFALAGKYGVSIKDSYIEAVRCGQPFSGSAITIEGVSTVVRLTAAENASNGVVVQCSNLQILEPLTVLVPEGAVIANGTIKDANGRNASQLVITNQEGFGEVEVQTVGEGTASAEKQYYGFGGTVKLSAKPAENMKIKSVQYLVADSEPAEVGDTLEFTMPASEKVTVIVTFEEVHVLTLATEVPATCEEDGTRAHYICGLCGRIFEDAEGETEITDPDSLIIPALDHDWDEGVVTKEPTASEEGERTYTCRHDRSHTYTEVIPALGEESSEEEVSEPESSEEEASEPESSEEESKADSSEEEVSKAAPTGSNGGTNPNTGAAAVGIAALAAGAAVIAVRKRK